MNRWKKAGKWLVSSLHSLELRWRFRNLWLLFRRQRRWWPAPNLRDLPRRRHYVAFLDLLGFGSKVEHDLDGALDTYDRIFRRIRGMSPSLLPSTTIAVVSDSVLLTSATLFEILQACHYFQHFALFENTLVRRGIGHGVQVQARRGQNLYVVSPALVQAARIEHTICHPCVVLAPAIEVPRSLYPCAGMHPFDRLLFFYDGAWVVSPFTRYFGESAMTRVAMMLNDHPEHKAKYDWFLGLYRAVTAGEWLVPDPAGDPRGA
jgi:hypothetical protein